MHGHRTGARADILAAEEPLGIRVDGAALTMTMRTPGEDIEPAARFLVGEAVIRSPADIAEIKLCDGTACGHGDHDGLGNIADVTLAPGVAIPPGCAAQLPDHQRVRHLREDKRARHLHSAAGREIHTRRTHRRPADTWRTAMTGRWYAPPHGPGSGGGGRESNPPTTRRAVHRF